MSEFSTINNKYKKEGTFNTVPSFYNVFSLSQFLSLKPGLFYQLDYPVI